MRRSGSSLGPPGSGSTAMSPQAQQEADNHRAERCLRPLVVARKGSGTRSAAGSRVRMALASLFATWQAQGRDPLLACRQVLLTQTL